MSDVIRRGPKNGLALALYCSTAFEHCPDIYCNIYACDLRLSWRHSIYSSDTRMTSALIIADRVTMKTRLYTSITLIQSLSTVCQRLIKQNLSLHAAIQAYSGVVNLSLSLFLPHVVMHSAD